MSDPILGLSMLGLIVAAIMMGFPTAFTMMGLGMFFGFLAFWDSSQALLENRVFDLMVQRTFGAMNNDTLLSIPLFVFMGYVIERAALVDRMFHSVQLAFRRMPASLAVTTLMVSAFWGIASGIVGAVVVLMGVIALRPMLNAGYDTRLAAGAITAGGTLGILIPPSVMLIVYAAVAGQSIVKLYAAAMLPGFFLTLLYLLYIVGWALINPKVAPKLPPEKYRVPVPDWLARLERGPRRAVASGLLTAMLRPGLLAGTTGPDGRPAGFGLIFGNVLAALLPIGLTVALFATAWWYIVIHNAPEAQLAAPTAAIATTATGLAEPPAEAESDKAEELGTNTGVTEDAETTAAEPVQELGGPQPTASPGAAGRIPENFHQWFWSLAVLSALVLLIYYRRMDGEQLEILKMLSASMVPLAILTFIVLAVILFGITTATESAGVGALGALYLASFYKYRRSRVQVR